ncbi:MAG: molybdopterin-synthase adenylyltransferase MoeB [Alphaproteobacteria bacterium]|nr:molybdopterin-synthase adenylyltransferase MoeB [Alphaproteobacteria bacterium]
MVEDDLTEPQIERYARHILLAEVGGVGQAKLLRSRVLVVGAGGLGAPAILYLAAAGIGTIGVVDDDTVSLSNLQRQIIHATARVGQRKTSSAAVAVAEINPDVRVIEHRERLTAANAMALTEAYDLVVDGSDNFPTRFLVNDACHLAGRTLVSGAILRFDGQLATFKSHEGPPHPCYRCLYHDVPPPDLIPSCAEAGVLGALAGTIGAMQATEALKELLGIGDSLSGSLLVYDALGTTIRKVRLKPDPACPLCGTTPTIRDLSRHAAVAHARA